MGCKPLRIAMHPLASVPSRHGKLPAAARAVVLGVLAPTAALGLEEHPNKVPDSPAHRQHTRLGCATALFLMTHTFRDVQLHAAARLHATRGQVRPAFADSAHHAGAKTRAPSVAPADEVAAAAVDKDGSMVSGTQVARLLLVRREECGLQ